MGAVTGVEEKFPVPEVLGQTFIRIYSLFSLELALHLFNILHVH